MAGHARVADGGSCPGGQVAQAAHGRVSRARAQPDRHAGPRDEGARHGPGVRRDRRHAGEGHARPGALGGGIAAAGQNAAAAKEKAEEKAEEDAAYAEHDAEEAQLRRSAEDQGKREAAEAVRAANHYWGDPGTLEEHFNAHGMDVGASSMEEYADMAHELYLNKGLCQVRVDEEGITRVYDAARNLFGSYATPTGRQGPTSRPPEARPTSTIRDGPCREHAREET